MNNLYETIPSYQYFYKIFLELLEDGNSYDRSTLFELVADKTGLTVEQRNIVMKKGVLLYKDRMAWALTYLKKAGLVAQPQRTYWGITDRGKSFIKENKNEIINEKKFADFPEFKDFLELKKASVPKAAESGNPFETITPDETIENIISSNIELLKSDLIEILKNRDPFLFEHTCKDLLLAMGYAGGIEELAYVTKKSNDGGIDCVIKQDPLGINNVYVQAKRYSGTVHEQEITYFLGALSKMQAQSGVFITTGKYSDKAIKVATQSSSKVVLIDGDELVSLMIKYKVGVESERQIEVLKINNDYFYEKD
jgi:Restriction endonuclease